MGLDCRFYLCGGGGYSTGPFQYQYRGGGQSCLPRPSAAALVAGFVWLSVDNKIPSYEFQAWIAFAITTYTGITMVSNAPFFSGKSLSLEKKLSPATIMLAVVLVFAVVSVNPPIVLFGLFVIYGLSGWGVWYFRWRKIRQRYDSRHNPDDPPV